LEARDFVVGVGRERGKYSNNLVEEASYITMQVVK